MNEIIEQLRGGVDLEAGQIEECAEALLGDEVGDEVKADFLRAFADKGERPDEIAGFVEAFLGRAVDPGVRGGGEVPILDVCGTGGDKLNLFNVSTTSMFVLAGGGVKVVKHGNRGITSKSGGADVLEALGIRIDGGPGEFAECIDEVGVGFLFAPLYHPAFKAVAPVRQVLAKEGRRTVFNLIGPLLNPARPDCQLVGVFAKELTPVFAEIMRSLGRKAAWAVHGTTEDGRGMDELSNLGETLICKAGSGDAVSEEVLDPTTLGLEGGSLEELAGGEAKENAEILTGILDGSERGAKRDIVCLNAAAGFVIAGKAADLGAGLELAGSVIDGGAAKEKLEALRAR